MKTLSHTPIHEVNSAGLHRIISFDKDGTPKIGEWSAPTAIAQNGALFASADPALGLPLCIFRLTIVAQRALS